MSQQLEIWELVYYGNDGERCSYESGTKSSLIEAHNNWLSESGNFSDEEIAEKTATKFEDLAEDWDLHKQVTIDLDKLQDGDTYNGAYDFAMKQPEEEKAFMMEFTFRVASRGKNKDELTQFAVDEFVNDSHGYVKDLEYGLAHRWIVGQQIDQAEFEDYFGIE
jgi:hypothetical protein